VAILVIPVDVSQKITTYVPKDGKILSDDERKLLVGGTQKADGVITNGWFEIIPHFTKFLDEKCVAIANEEGRIYSMPLNERATEAWRKCLGSRGGSTAMLVGPVVIFTRENMKGWA
jgi:phosphoketolase